MTGQNDIVELNEQLKSVTHFIQDNIESKIVRAYTGDYQGIFMDDDPKKQFKIDNGFISYISKQYPSIYFSYMSFDQNLIAKVFVMRNGIIEYDYIINGHLIDNPLIN